MLFVFGGLATFVIGGLTGVMVAMATFDFQAHDTFFVVAHLHTVLIGGTVFPFLAACYYYFPLVTGYALSNRLGRICFWLVFVGFKVTFMPMHVSGLLGMPRRVFTYPSDPNLNLLNLTSTIGAFILAAGFAVFLWDVLRPKRKQGHSPRNPWGSGTLEWLPEMPAKPWGLRSIPEIDSRYPLWEQQNFERDVDEGRFFLPDAEELKREMLVTSVIDARPEQCLRISGPSYVPLVAAIFTGGIFIFPTFKLWTWMAVSTVLALGSILYWLWTATALIPEKEEKYIGHGVSVPLYVSGSASVGWWAMLITMLADITAFASMVFGYFFYWTLRPEFPPSGIDGPGTLWPAVALALLLAAWALTFAARRWNGRDQGGVLLPGDCGWRGARAWRRRGAPGRAVGARDGAQPARLPGHGLGAGRLDRAARRCRRGHAALLRRPSLGRAHEREVRHRHLEHDALLALRGVDGRR